MKKVFCFMMAGLVCAGLSLTSCDSDDGPKNDTTVVALSTPTLSVDVSGTTAVISWAAVDNAGSYEYSLIADDTEKGSGSTTELSLTFEELSAGDYTISVTAVPSDTDSYSKSEAATTTFAIEGGDDDSSLSSATGYISNVTATAGSITFTINSEGECGFYYLIISPGDMEELYDWFELSFDSEEDIQSSAGFLFYWGGLDLQNPGTTVFEITETPSYYYGMFGGTGIASETTYLIVAVEDTTGNRGFSDEDIEYVWVTTAA